MAYQEQRGGEGGEVLFQKNWDKDAQHEIEELSGQLIESIKGYCTEMGSDNIVEPQAVSHITGKLSKILHICDSLYIKYHEQKHKDEKLKDGTIIKGNITEGYKLILNFKSELIGKYTLNGTNVVKRLEELMQQELKDIAVKHRLMDKVGDKEPWEREVMVKYFPE